MPISISPSSSRCSGWPGLNSSTPARPCASSQMPVRAVCVRCASRRLCGVKGAGRRCGKKPRMSVTAVMSEIHTSARESEYCQAKSAATPQFSRYCASSTGPIGRIDSRSTSHWMAKRPSSSAAGATMGAVVEFIGRSTI